LDEEDVFLREKYIENEKEKMLFKSFLVHAIAND